MSLDSKIVKDTPAARRFRLLAPLAALLALAALTLAPGIIAELKNGDTAVGAIPPQALTKLAVGPLPIAAAVQAAEPAGALVQR